MSIDIIQGVAGLTGSRVWDRSITLVTPSDKVFRILHPFDLLQSRAYNIAHFSEKQNNNGRMQLQLQLALQVANRYIRETKRKLGARTALKQIEEIVGLAKSNEARRLVISAPITALPFQSMPSKTKIFAKSGGRESWKSSMLRSRRLTFRGQPLPAHRTMTPATGTIPRPHLC